MFKIIASVLLTAFLVPAQLALVGRPDWTSPCHDYAPVAGMGTIQSFQSVTTYNGVQGFGVGIGGPLYMRSQQHDICPALTPGVTPASWFLIGSRTSSPVDLYPVIPGLVQGASTVYVGDPQMFLYSSSALESGIGTHYYLIQLPFDTALVGVEVACQSVALHPIAGILLFGGNTHYVRVTL